MKDAFVCECDGMLSDALTRRYPWLSAGKVRLLVSGKNVRLRGVRVSSDVRVCRGDEAEVFLPSSFAPPETDVIYSDDNIVVADKPAHTDSVRALPALLRPSFGELYPAHRLDTNTTGIIVLARSPRALHALEKAFRARTVKKKYEAVVVGALPSPSGTLRCYLIKDDKRGLVRAADAPSRGAVEAVTDYEVTDVGDGLSYVALYPHTGRTHQLRVQLAHAGCPILGDGKYGDFAENRRRGESVQRLRATGIKFLSVPAPLEYLAGREFEVKK